MAKREPYPQAGFSLVELLVAVMFIGLLMAGMANVFKSSVSTLTTSSEGISSARRNRMSIDLLYDDLNTAGLYITNLSAPPQLDTSNPAFYILPNMPVTGSPAADDPQTADELYFYLDQPLPFEGTLTGTGGVTGANVARNASQLVMAGTAPVVADSTFTVDCGDPSYAKLVHSGHSVVIKDSWEIFNIQGAPTVGGSGNKSVTFTIGVSPTVAMTGVGPSGAPTKTQHLLQSAVLFYQPAQMVRYQVQMKPYDPDPLKAAGVPCLVRDQGTYTTTGFVAVPALQSIVAENIAGFRAYLSANSGTSWAGLNGTDTAFNPGWKNIQAALDVQVAATGRANFTKTTGNQGWLRDIPTLVRLDITTRTAMKRAEYSTKQNTTGFDPNNPVARYKTFTQSLVIVPRHFGLTMN